MFIAVSTFTGEAAAKKVPEPPIVNFCTLRIPVNSPVKQPEFKDMQTVDADINSITLRATPGTFKLDGDGTGDGGSMISFMILKEIF